MTATAKTTIKRTRTSTKRFPTKTAEMLFHFRRGATITEVTEKVKGVGYSFAYGVAKRNGFATTAANRRKSKSDKFTEFAIWMGVEPNKAATLAKAFLAGEAKPEPKKRTRAAKPKAAENTSAS